MEPMRRDSMRRMRRLLVILLAAALGGCPAGVEAQDVEELFRTVTPAVVVIRAKGREVTSTRGLVTFNAIGYAVLISPAGTVMAAAHAVHAMAGSVVEFLGGATVRPRMPASELAAALAMGQIGRVNAAAQVARLGGSDRVRVGHQVLVIVAAYALSDSFSAVWMSAESLHNT